MTQRGFPNIAIVREALGALVPAIKQGALPSPPRSPWTVPPAPTHQTPVIRVQHLARRVAETYGLDVGLIVVAFRSDIEQAGRVELGGRWQRDFFIDLREEFAQQDAILSAILGHEVAHIFLHRHHLHPPMSLYAEIMTDITAVLYGFGPVIADTFRVTERIEPVFVGTRTTRTVHHMGYLTPDEVGFVLFRSGFDLGACMRALTSRAARSALRIGRTRARRELTAPPFRCAAWWKRLTYRVQRWWSELAWRWEELDATRLYALTEGHVHFRCVLCCQGLRAPTRKKLTAVCPRCRTAMPCLT